MPENMKIVLLINPSRQYTRGILMREPPELKAIIKMNVPTLCIRPTHVAARQSTDVLAMNDADVVTALRFIRRTGRFNIAVQQVVERTSLSRRALEQRFRSVLGHSIHDEIQRVRAQNGIVCRCAEIA